MTENTFLFIGGPADGRRITVTNPGEDVRYVTPVAPTGFIRGEERIDVYRSSKLGGNSKKFFVYVLDGMTGDEVIASLLKGYRHNA
jgi:hypothetical protein